MKFYLNYESLKAICLSLAHRLQIDFAPDEIVAISRGGLTPAHIIAKALRLPVGIYYPGLHELNLYNPDAKRLAFVEDLVAKGRTFREVTYVMKEHKNISWTYVPILIDGYIDFPEIKFYGIKTHHWCVMPWEDFDSMKEGDRGLFREGTDSYGK